MNKQELINKLNKILTTPSETEGSDFDIAYNYAIKRAILLAEDLDEPVRPPEPKPLELEKPAVPKFVADMIAERKKQKYGIVETIQNLNVFNNPFDYIIENQFKWVIENQEDFIKAWLYGYEIEKEKLYTAMLKISGEYLRIDCNGNFGHFKVDRKYILDGARAYRFTKDNLVEYHIWENDNYEIKEVEW